MTHAIRFFDLPDTQLIKFGTLSWRDGKLARTTHAALAQELFTEVRHSSVAGPPMCQPERVSSGGVSRRALCSRLLFSLILTRAARRRSCAGACSRALVRA